MHSDAIDACFRRFQAANPNPTTELHYGNTFQLLIAVMLSAQTTDARVNIVTPELFAKAPDPATMLALGEEGIRQLIRSIGLFNSKARHIAATCARLVHDFGGNVPTRREDLESLPGVGRKTANVVLNTALRLPTMAVDTHIFRVANRTGMGRGRNVREVEEALLQSIPPQWLLDAHHWLILHGRYVCTARKPACSSCLIQDLCDAHQEKTLPLT